jgi:hypothetical protein
MRMYDGDFSFLVFELELNLSGTAIIAVAEGTCMYRARISSR